MLAALPAADFERLQPKLERVPLALGQMLITAHEPIRYAYFPLSGIISTVAQIYDDRIEVGLIGYEGLSSTAVILGADRTPHTSIVQGVGEALRIRRTDLQAALLERPSLFRPFGLYVQFFITQMAQTIYANTAFGLEARLARWILMAHDRIEGDELLLTHDFLSIMLGVRRPGVTTASHVLEGAGMIRNKRGRITVLDREKLMDLAGEAYQVAEIEYERLAAGV
nr:Crp/Fnr family transcriptional regulator [Methylobacterium brachythecii]